MRCDGHSSARLSPKGTIRTLAVLWLLGTLVGCGFDAPSTPVAEVATAAEPSATASPTALPMALPTATPLPAASPTDALTATPTPTALPTARPTAPPTALPTAPPSPTPTPLLPVLSPVVAGRPLPLSLSGQFGANGYLTAGMVATHDSGAPIYLAASLGRRVYALNDGGAILWEVSTASPVYAMAPVGPEQVAVGEDSGQVTWLTLAGKRVAQADLGSRVVALEAWQEGLLAGGWDERLTYLDSKGQVGWQADLPGPLVGLAVQPQRALAATLRGGLVAFDLNGEQAWTYKPAVPVAGIGAVPGDEAAFLASLQNGDLLALDRDGALLWQRALSERPGGAVVWQAAHWVGEDTVQMAVGAGGPEPLLALLSTEGSVFWRVALPAPANAIAATDVDRDGVQEILVGLANGELHAYDGEGRLRGQAHAGLSIWGLDAGAEGAILVRADVVAWSVQGQSASAGGPWLPPPAMVPLSWTAPVSPIDDLEGRAVLAFVGDVALGRSMESQLLRQGVAYPWGGIGSLLHTADLAVANLECVLTTGGKPLDKRYLIRAHPLWAESLQAAGFDLVNVANNHIYDYGQPGVDQTLETLEALEIAAVGAGRNHDEAHRPALFEVNSVRVAVVGYAAARWYGSIDLPATDRVAWAVPERVAADVAAARGQADVVVVLLHAGTEYASEPSADQSAVAHAAVDAGADLVVGHHPHVTQTVERYKQGLIVYSLGDAVFDIPRRAAMLGDLLRVEVTRHGIVQAELWPFWIEDAIRPRFLDNGTGAPQVRVLLP